MVTKKIVLGIGRCVIIQSTLVLSTLLLMVCYDCFLSKPLDSWQYTLGRLQAYHLTLSQPLPRLP